MNFVHTAATLMKDGLVELGALMRVEHSAALDDVMPPATMPTQMSPVAAMPVRPAFPGRRIGRGLAMRRRGAAYGPWQRVTRG